MKMVLISDNFAEAVLSLDGLSSVITNYNDGPAKAILVDDYGNVKTLDLGPVARWS